MNQDHTVFAEMLNVIGSSISLAEDAVKAAEENLRQSPEPVTLVKVAREKCFAAAGELIKTGAFREYTQNDLTRCLETAGAPDLIELLEKLASRAVFPLDADSFSRDGDLVDKPATARTGARTNESKTDLWVRISAEVGL